MRVFGDVLLEKGEISQNGGTLPLYSLPALATSLLRPSIRELPEAPLLCALEAGSRILLAGSQMAARAAGMPDTTDEIQMGKMTCRLISQSDTPQIRAIKTYGRGRLAPKLPLG